MISGNVAAIRERQWQEIMGLIGLLKSEGIEVCWADGDDYPDGMQYTMECAGGDADMRRAVKLAVDKGCRPMAVDGHWDLDDEGNATGEFRMHFHREEGGSGDGC